MNKKIYVDLTEEQRKAFAPLFELVDKAFYDNKPGSILAQVYGYDSSFYIIARFADNELTTKIQKATGVIKE